MVVIGEVEGGLERGAEKGAAQRGKIGVVMIKAAIDAPGDGEAAAGPCDRIVRLAQLQEPAGGKLARGRDERLDGTDRLADEHGHDAPDRRGHLVQRVAQILHLIVAGVAGDEAHDLECHFG
jgi:hypothetical protein